MRLHALNRGQRWWSLSPFASGEDGADEPSFDAGSVHSRILRVGPSETFRGDTDAATRHIAARVADGWHVVLTVEGRGLAQRLVELLQEAGLRAHIDDLNEARGPATSPSCCRHCARVGARRQPASR
ncbi:hypothetical protein G7085_06245 [Tessaracoccus sp. HDW20]|nr:hypothetical protein [Tessaracoccus coleopterorum]